MDRQPSNVIEKTIPINIFGKTAGVFVGQFQLTVLIILMITALGVTGLQGLPRESLPEIIFPAISVQTLFPGASPEDVETLVTEVIENKIKDLDDIETIESVTQFGFSQISITYLEDVDIDRKKIELDNALRELSFADGVQDPEAFIFSTSEIPLMNLSVSGDYELTILSGIAEDITDSVEAVAGVDEVVVAGDVTREIEVVLDELEMMAYGISFNEVKDAISVKNINVPIGEVDLNGVRFNLRVDERFTDLEALENTLIRDNIYVKDVAIVVDGIATVESYNRTYIDGNDTALPSLFLTVNRKVGSDVIGTSSAIRELLENGRGSLYPDDVTVYISNDLANDVSNDLEKIQGSAWSGLLVVVVVLFLFIGFREALIVALTIPLSLLGTLGVLNFFGITFNTFAVLGLIVALGLLVDNAIIVMENIDRLRLKGLDSKEAAYYGTNQVGYPVASATFTTLAAFFPLAILPGILGAFVSTIPITIMITVSVSLLVSVIITPSLSSKILGVKGKFKVPKPLMVIFGTGLVGGLSYVAFLDVGPRWLGFAMTGLFVALMLAKLIFASEAGLEDTALTRSYARIIGWIVTKPWRSVALVLIGLGTLVASFSVFGTGLLKISFFPVNEPQSLVVTIDTPGGMTLKETDTVAGEAEEALYRVDGIEQFNTTVGGNEIDKVVITMALDTSMTNGFRIRENVEEALAKVPGGTINIQGLASGPPVGKPIELQIYGEALDTSKDFSEEVGEYLANIPGVYNIESTLTSGVPQLLIDINETKSLAYNLDPSSIAGQLRGEINGVKAGTFRDQGEDIDIMLRKDLAVLDEIEKVENLIIATTDGHMVTLRDFTTIEELSGISNISRKDGVRVITVSADLKEGFNINDTAAALRSRYTQATIPEGVDLVYAGDVEGIEESFTDLFQSMILAIFLVFIILTVQFRSVLQPFIILTTLPMAFIGVIWGLVLTGNEFGFYAFMGIVALIGIAANDAIVLIDYMNFLRSSGKDLVSAVKEAGRTRFSPVFATTLTTISGVLPLAFKEAYYAQFSFALIFGLLVTTVLTLLFIPTIYGLFTRRKEEAVNES